MSESSPPVGSVWAGGGSRYRVIAQKPDSRWKRMALAVDLGDEAIRVLIPLDRFDGTRLRRVDKDA